MTPNKVTTHETEQENYSDQFSEPRTIPGGWDLSNYFSSTAYPDREVNGTAYEFTRKQDDDGSQNSY